jgi:hypothetical protein
VWNIRGQLGRKRWRCWQVIGVGEGGREEASRKGSRGSPAAIRRTGRATSEEPPCGFAQRHATVRSVKHRRHVTPGAAACRHAAAHAAACQARPGGRRGAPLGRRYGEACRRGGRRGAACHAAARRAAACHVEGGPCPAAAVPSSLQHKVVRPRWLRQEGSAKPNELQPPGLCGCGHKAGDEQATASCHLLHSIPICQARLEGHP